VLRPPEFILLLQSLQRILAPRRIRRNSETLPDYAVDFVAKKELVHGELSSRLKRRNGFVANFEERGAGDRVLVDFDLILDVQIVFVLQRSW
jgi:hypothetical protein